MFTSRFAKISKSTEKSLTYSLLYLFLISIVVMRYFDRFLINETATKGILSFEFSKTINRSVEILDSWSSLAKTYAGLSLGYDFLFLIIYTLFIAVLIHKLNERLWAHRSFYRVGEILIWSMFFTAIFDSVENAALIKLLIGGRQQYWSTIAYYFAGAKFLLIFISVIYILINTVMLLFKKRL